MVIDRDTAMKLWRFIYGEQLFALDCFGTYICREDYGDHEKKRIRPNGDGRPHVYGWDIDHIRPKSSFKDENDANFMNNLEPLHFSNNQEKSDDYPSFVVSKEKYRVVVDYNGGYGIVNSAGQRIDWKKNGKHY